MRKFLHLSGIICLMLISMNAMAGYQAGYDLNYSQTRSDAFQLEIALNKYNVQTVNKEGTMYSDIDFPGQVVTKKAGWAEVPYFGIPVQIPADKNVSVEITSIQYEVIRLEHPMLPSRGVIYRNEDPD